MPKQKDDSINNKNNKLLVEQFNLLVNQIKYDLSTKKLTKSEINKYQFKLRHLNEYLVIIQKYPEKIKNGNDLKGKKGIGKGTIERINEILKTKNLKEVDKTKIKKIVEKNNIVEDLSSVINIGSKVAKQLIDKYKLKV